MSARCHDLPLLPALLRFPHVSSLDLPMVGRSILDRAGFSRVQDGMTARRTSAGWMFVSLVLAMLAFAPTQALAHAGHSHKQGQIQTISVPKRSPETQAVKATLPPTKSKVAALRGLAPALTDRDESNQTTGCLSGCCQAGSHCCPVSLTLAAPNIDPPLGRSYFPSATRRGLGITPSALSKPPKSLA